MPSCSLTPCGGRRAQLGADCPLSLLGNTFLIHETSKEVYWAPLSAIFRLKLLGFGISWVGLIVQLKALLKAKVHG